MKAFAFGFLSALGIVLLCVAGVYLYIISVAKEAGALNWSERAPTAVTLTVKPEEQMDFSSLLGSDARKLARQLAQGDASKKAGYRAIFESGFDVTIQSELNDNGIGRMETVYFRDGSVGANLYSSEASVELFRDGPSPDAEEIKGAENLSGMLESLEDIERLRNEAKEQRARVEVLEDERAAGPEDPEN